MVRPPNHFGPALLISSKSRPARPASLTTLALLVFACLSITPQAPAQPNAPGEQVRLERAIELRKVLTRIMDHAFENGGAWPDELIPSPQRPFIYGRPESTLNNPYGELLAVATPVLHEPIADHPAGVWVGFADGHLEFAHNAEALVARDIPLGVVKSAIAAHGHPLTGAATPPEPNAAVVQPAGKLKLKVVDEDGHPVSGAFVGISGRFGDLAASSGPVTFPHEHNDRPEISNGNGEVLIDAGRVFGTGFSAPAHAPASALYILHQNRRLVALEEIRPEEFGAVATRTVCLRPACRVHGRLTSAGFAGATVLNKTTALLYKPGQFGLRALGSTSANQQFELLVPPGEYGIWLQGSGTYVVQRFVRIEPGRKDLLLEIDVPARQILQLIGQPAPELRNIKGWKNGAPVKLSDQRGKVILLDFWGYWCGPCIGSMPHLIKLHDELAEKGLVIIAVHDDSVESIDEMDRRLEAPRKEFWGGRHLPFLIALDGGGRTRFPGIAMTARGATTAAYGIMSFPTTLLIAADGTLLRQIEPGDPAARRQIEALLDK